MLYEPTHSSTWNSNKWPPRPGSPKRMTTVNTYCISCLTTLLSGEAHTASKLQKLPSLTSVKAWVLWVTHNKTGWRLSGPNWSHRLTIRSSTSANYRYWHSRLGLSWLWLRNHVLDLSLNWNFNFSLNRKLYF